MAIWTFAELIRPLLTENEFSQGILAFDLLNSQHRRKKSQTTFSNREFDENFAISRNLRAFLFQDWKAMVHKLFLVAGPESKGTTQNILCNLKSKT